MSASLQINEIHLRVADLARSLDFYVGRLGFQEKSAPAGSATLAAAAQSAVLLRLEEDGRAPAAPRDAAGLFHAALFAMCCIAAGIERIPRASWPLIAAMLVTASLQIALDVSSTPLHPLRPAALAHSQVFEGAITLYLFIAPALAGMLAAWLWRRFNPRNPANPGSHAGPTASS